MKKKNILYVMCDQLRWDAVFDDKNPCKMPVTKAFAEKAVNFSKAYTMCPLCTPARGALFTGMWPHQNLLVDNQGPYWPHRQLPMQFKTYLERLQDNGYNIGYTGKWHCGNGGLNKRGIEDVRISDGGVSPANKNYPQEPQKPEGKWYKPYYLTYSEGNDADRRRCDAGKDQLRELSEKYKNDGIPFCSVISFIGPHFPHTIPKKYADMYADLPKDFMPDNFCEQFSEENLPKASQRHYWPTNETKDLNQEDWRLMCQHYWGFCTYIDDLFQEIQDVLEDEDLWKDTVVAFSPDHGEMLGAHGRFDKGPDFYEETVKIPMLIWDPEQRKPVNPDSYINLIDLYPTMLSLANAEDVLKEEEKPRSYWKTDNEYVFMSYDAYHGRNLMARGVRTDEYKYTWRPNDLDELFDMKKDPGEMNNLVNSEAHASVIEELKGTLFKWMEEEGDYLRYAKHLPEPGSYIDGRPYDSVIECDPKNYPTRGVG